MTFTKAIKTCLGKYVTFSGRARRSEYWWFFLAFVIGAVVIALVDGQLFGYGTPHEPASQPLSAVYKLALFLPMLAAGFRRLQDTGRPGWYLLIPVMLSVAMMFFMFSGIVGFSMMENAGVSQDTLRAPAVAIGMTGMIAAGIAQLVIGFLLLWWLTRPSQGDENAYGPAPQ